MWDIFGKLVALILFLRLSWSVIKGIYGTFLADLLKLNCDFTKKGKWAVVTGATDGIGKAYAFEIARRGMNVVLVSRTPSKLKDVEAEIKSKYEVEVRYIAVDFTKTDIYEMLQKELDDLDIGLLVNNVGMGYDHPEFYTKLPGGEELVYNLINCNMTSVAMMTHIVLPGMEKRRRGVIINISSLSAAIPAPLLTVYAASKAFVESFSDGLRIEYATKGVIVQCILPGFVVSKLSKISRPSLLAPNPQPYVRAAFRTLGVESRSCGYYTHKLQMYFIEIIKTYLPGVILDKLTFNELNTIRIKSEKRKQQHIKAE